MADESCSKALNAATIIASGARLLLLPRLRKRTLLINGKIN